MKELVSVSVRIQLLNEEMADGRRRVDELTETCKTLRINCGDLVCFKLAFEVRLVMIAYMPFWREL